MTTPSYVDPDTIQRPSTGSIASVAWGDQVNDDLNYLYANLAESLTWTDEKTWNWSGDVLVPSGASGYIGPIPVAVPSGTTVTLAGVLLLTRSGTVTLSIEHNGTAITGLSGITATTTSSGLVAPTDTVTFANLDLLVPLVSAISDTPDGLTVTAFLQRTVTLT